MRSYFLTLFLILLSLPLSAQFHNYVIVGKGSQGQMPCSGTLSVGNNKIRISTNTASYEWFVGDAKYINKKTLRYPILGNSSYIEIQQSSVNEDVYFFVVPNFPEGQTGRSTYKTIDEKAAAPDQVRKDMH